MGKLHVLASSLLFLICSTVYAGHSQKAELQGFVASFDATTVKIYVQGQFVTVPKSSISKGSKIAVGSEVTAFVDMKNTVQKN